MHPRRKVAAAGAIAATVWGALEPLDQRLFRSSYSDVAVLGKFFTRGRGWLPVGLALHALNGAVFGLVYGEARSRTKIDERKLALGMALLEHLALYPLGHLVDRYHPARGEPGVRGLIGRRPLAQGLLRHAVFGVLLGRLGTEDRSARTR